MHLQTDKEIIDALHPKLGSISETLTPTQKDRYVANARQLAASERADQRAALEQNSDDSSSSESDYSDPYEPLSLRAKRVRALIDNERKFSIDVLATDCRPA